MSDEEIKRIEEDLVNFAGKFEEVSMTLIARMAEITDKLSRITSSVEMVDKLRIQNAENKQVMNNIKTGMKNLTRRLQNMCNDGFVVPDSPSPETAAASMASSLDQPYESSEEVDDLSDLGEPPSVEDLQKANAEVEVTPEEPQLQAELEPSIEPEIEPVESSQPEPEAETEPDDELTPEEPQLQAEPEAEPTTTSEAMETVPEPQDEKEPSQPEPEQAKDEDTTSVEETIEPLEHVKSASGIPKSNLERIANPATPKDFMQNLIIDIEEANLEEHVGKLILQTKERLSKINQFHTIYFEMIMTGGKIKTSQKPNSPELVAEMKEKINGWMQKL